MEGRQFGSSPRFFISLLLSACLPIAAANDVIVINADEAPPGMDFAAEVREALDYIACDVIVDDVLSLATRIEIRYTDGRTRVLFQPRHRSAVIDFNPRRGTGLEYGRIQSPALMLAHELGHIYRALHGVHGMKNAHFTPAEELAVIKEIETRVARLIGEPVRRRYAGIPVTTASVTPRPVPPRGPARESVRQDGL